MPDVCCGPRFRAELVATAKAVVAPGKGILATDEPPFRMKERLGALGVEATDETQRKYRELLSAAVILSAKHLYMTVLQIYSVSNTLI